jgi:hypothetical protein
MAQLSLFAEDIRRPARQARSNIRLGDAAEAFVIAKLLKAVGAASTVQGHGSAHAEIAWLRRRFPSPRRGVSRSGAAWLTSAAPRQSSLTRQIG